MNEYAAVLITAYNRPKHLRSLMTQVAGLPCKIYVAIDAASDNDLINKELVRQCLDVIDEYSDRFSDVRIAKEKQGCFIGVSSAISWAFTKEPRLIIIEDDIQVSEAFFLFATQMLDDYEDVKGVGSIAGTDLVPDAHKTDLNSSFRFSAFTSSWGWATWANRWQDYEKDLLTFPHMDFENPKNFWNFSSKHYWSKVFSDTIKGRFDAWDYRWLYSNWKNNRLTIIPNKNLVLNVGFGKDATHTRDEVLPWWLPTEITESFRVQVPPKAVSRDVRADQWMEANHFRTKPIQQLRNGLSSKFPRMAEVYRRFLKK